MIAMWHANTKVHRRAKANSSNISLWFLCLLPWIWGFTDVLCFKVVFFTSKSSFEQENNLQYMEASPSLSYNWLQCNVIVNSAFLFQDRLKYIANAVQWTFPKAWLLQFSWSKLAARMFITASVGSLRSEQSALFTEAICVSAYFSVSTFLACLFIIGRLFPVTKPASALVSNSWHDVLQGIKPAVAAVPDVFCDSCKSDLKVIRTRCP